MQLKGREKPKSKKEVLKTILITLVLLAAVFLYAHVKKPNYLYDRSLDTDEYGICAMYAYDTATEAFTCRTGHMDAVRLVPKYNGDTADVSLHLELKDALTDRLLAEADVTGAQLAGAKTYDLTFPRETDAKDKRYLFSVTETGQTAENYIDFSHAASESEGTTLTVGGDTLQDTSILLRTVARGFDPETFVVLGLFVAYIVFFFKFLFKLFN